MKYIYLICLALGSLIVSSCNDNKKLPIYGEREAKITKDANGKEVVDTIYQTIPAFGFLNQDSIIITQDAFKDKVYIADFFFTSCPTICPVMKKQMVKVYNEFKAGTLHSGSEKGPKVKNRKQAIAIALSEARKGKK